MARVFNSTDKLLTTATFALPATFTGYAWVKAPRVDGTNGRVWELGSTVPVKNALFRETAAWDFTANFSTTAGQWKVNDSTLGGTLTDWNHIAVTYDGGSTSNLPTCYWNGVASTMSQIVAPVGTYDTTSSEVFIGNRTAANRSLGSGAGLGVIAHVALHNVILSAGEIAEAMFYGFTPRGLYGYWPIFGDSPEASLAGTSAPAAVTGTSINAGPPVAHGFGSTVFQMIQGETPPVAVAGRKSLMLLGVG